MVHTHNVLSFYLFSIVNLNHCLGERILVNSLHTLTYKQIDFPKKSAKALAYLLSEEYNLKFDSTAAWHAIQNITAFVLGYSSWKSLKSTIQSANNSAIQVPLSLCDEQCASDTELTERRLFQEQRFLSGLHFLQQYVPEDVLLQFESKAEWIIKQWQPSAAARYASAFLSVNRKKYVDNRLHIDGYMLSKHLVKIIKNDCAIVVKDEHIQLLIDGAVVFAEHGLDPHVNPNTAAQYKDYAENCGIIATNLLNQTSFPEKQQQGWKLLQFLCFQVKHPYCCLQLAQILSTDWYIPPQQAYASNTKFEDAHIAIGNAHKLFQKNPSGIPPKKSTLLELHSTKARVYLVLPQEGDSRPSYKKIEEIFQAWSKVSPLGTFYYAALHFPTLDLPPTHNWDLLSGLKQYFCTNEQANNPNLALEYFKQFQQCDNDSNDSNDLNDLNDSLDGHIAWLKDLGLFPQNVLPQHLKDIANAATAALLVSSN